ncbi:uncharacterized protein Gasu_22010 [Galdieria sulphuraria]|uniref:Methyltransferase FkbM domain-containing protein n=1 Tax=Galdieria sulphuraria TaxID=130081 RepID=M2Y3X8_GALSU|nr:uncharacterized protein Gasu_22010 [Galdieria sulphuraria]EME30529.1 hypothetical protein Gasu_22010 [Galdieria sulphuraria]|eukprot:XP_005707049.1 hypothetical protein Gasu_22010 [Galdieria sulphuraria]
MGKHTSRWLSPHSTMDKSICPNFYFDLGSNVGDSIVHFVLHNITSVGSTSSALRRFANRIGVVSSEYCVYGFEGNPIFNDGLKKLEQLLQGYTKKTEIRTETVVTDEDGTTQLYLDLVNEDHHFWGSSIHNDTRDIVKSGSQAVNVTAVDFAKFLKQRVVDKRECKGTVPMVVVRMDIEGAEYRVIRSLFEQGLLCHYIDYLIVEFHEDSAPINSSIPQVLAWFMENNDRCQTQFIFEDIENDY